MAARDSNASADIPHGYDSSLFLSEVSEDFKCVICRLVLRKPLQLRCGDRYCKFCFDSLKAYSSHLGTGLVCPVEREPVEIDKIFEDKAVARTIRELKVKCQNHDRGCCWTGSLEDLERHGESCQYQKNGSVTPDSNGIDELKYLCKDLYLRVQNLERRSAEKGNDLTLLKEELSKMEEEKLLMKASLREFRLQVGMLKQANEKYANEMKTLHDELGAIKILIDHQKETEANVGILIKQTNEKHAKEIKSLHDQLDLMKIIIDHRNEVETNVVDNNPERKKSQKRCSENADEYVFDDDNIKRRKLHSEENQEEDQKVGCANIKCLSDFEALKKEVESIKIDLTESKSTGQADFQTLENHVSNIEKVFFLKNSIENKYVKFKFVLQNFHYHNEVGKPVRSPIFFSQIAGYRFQLVIKWKGLQKDALGVYLQLHRGDNEVEKNVNPFHYEFALEVPDKHGDREFVYMPFSHIENSNSLRILPGRAKANSSCGISNLLSSPYDDYVIQDTMHFVCTVYL